MSSTSDIVIRPARPEDRLALARMLELYQYELSDIWDQDLDANGEYGYALDRYWAAGAGKAFVATVGGHYAGFALVDDAVKVGASGHWMDQFFVMKKFRRSGLGTALAHTVFRAVPGQWEVGQMPQNVRAQAFWRKAIAEFTGGVYVEQEVIGGWWQGVVQSFASPPP